MEKIDLKNFGLFHAFFYLARLLGGIHCPNWALHIWNPILRQIGTPTIWFSVLSTSTLINLFLENLNLFLCYGLYVEVLRYFVFHFWPRFCHFFSRSISCPKFFLINLSRLVSYLFVRRLMYLIHYDVQMIYLANRAPLPTFFDQWTNQKW